MQKRNIGFFVLKTLSSFLHQQGGNLRHFRTALPHVGDVFNQWNSSELFEYLCKEHDKIRRWSRKNYSHRVTFEFFLVVAVFIWRKLVAFREEKFRVFFFHFQSFACKSFSNSLFNCVYVLHVFFLPFPATDFIIKKTTAITTKVLHGSWSPVMLIVPELVG